MAFSFAVVQRKFKEHPQISQMHTDFKKTMLTEIGL